MVPRRRVTRECTETQYSGKCPVGICQERTGKFSPKVASVRRFKSPMLYQLSYRFTGCARPREGGEESAARVGGSLHAHGPPGQTARCPMPRSPRAARPGGDGPQGREEARCVGRAACGARLRQRQGDARRAVADGPERDRSPTAEACARWPSPPAQRSPQPRRCDCACSR